MVLQEWSCDTGWLVFRKKMQCWSFLCFISTDNVCLHCCSTPHLFPGDISHTIKDSIVSWPWRGKNLWRRINLLFKHIGRSLAGNQIRAMAVRATNPRQFSNGHTLPLVVVTVFILAFQRAMVEGSLRSPDTKSMRHHILVRAAHLLEIVCFFVCFLTQMSFTSLLTPVEQAVQHVILFFLWSNNEAKVGQKSGGSNQIWRFGFCLRISYFMRVGQ